MRFVMIAGGGVLPLFGPIGISLSLDPDRDTHPGIIEERGTVGFGSASRSAEVEVQYVRVRDLVTGQVERIENSDLHDAVGDDGEGDEAELEIQTSDESVTAVRYEDEWYGTGASVAGLVFGIVVVLLGAFLLWRGVRRLRRT